MTDAVDPKQALLESMNASAADFAARSAKTRTAFHRGEHRQLLSQYAAESRQRLKTFLGEEEGGSNGGNGDSNAGNTNGGDIPAAEPHTPRTDAGG